MVAMATLSFQSLIMGKVESDSFCQVFGDIWCFFFSEMFIE